ncbi:MAG: gamma-glutamyl-gamma-aminobutyrate hydrolase family protein [Ignavibacteria bacterium]|nr:gamma-glutamyl-gamma-aminobutyrate hydrolase family protein [Ignavibacteria bacterium]
MIGLTLSETGFEYYIKWLKYHGTNYTILDYKSDSVFDDIIKCTGFILTGGVDIYPELYNDWETKEDAGKFNPERDGFELKLMDHAYNTGKPVYGICRGCQLVNVYFKGSLIYDLQSIRNVNHTKIDKDTLRIHPVRLVKNSQIYEIIRREKGFVTSSHHQAIDRPGEGIIVTSKSPDGVIESIEHEDSSKFIIGVQWHPERFSDSENLFSKNILSRLMYLTK